MTNELDERNKIIKSFLVIGLNTSFIQKYEEEKNPPRFTQDIDIFIKELPYNYKSPNSDEKWILLIKENNVWLRIKYSYNYSSPITDLQLAECDYESPEFLLLEKKYKDKEYFPLMVTYYKDKEPAQIPKPLPSANLNEFTNEWDVNFINSIELDGIFDLINAANYMDINSLLDLACAKIASLMKGKSAQEIRAMFNIECDLTEDELKEYEEYQI